RTLGEGADCRIIRIAQKLDTHAFALWYALCREKAATRRGALVRDSLSRKDEASENAGLL
ncbi:hypothetical protein ACR2VI_26840, partial [Klebsiella pneumoniae]